MRLAAWASLLLAELLFMGHLAAMNPEPEKPTPSSPQSAAKPEAVPGDFWQRVEVHIGAGGGFHFGANSLFRYGVSLSESLEFRYDRNFGLFIGFSFGQLNTKNAELIAGNYSLKLAEGGGLNLLSAQLAPQFSYFFADKMHVSLAAGVSLVQLYSRVFYPDAIISVLVIPAFWYEAADRLELGGRVAISYGKLSGVSANGSDLTLTKSVTVLDIALILGARYRIK